MLLMISELKILGIVNRFSNTKHFLKKLQMAKTTRSTDNERNVFAIRQSPFQCYSQNSSSKFPKARNFKKIFEALKPQKLIVVTYSARTIKRSFPATILGISIPRVLSRIWHGRYIKGEIFFINPSHVSLSP